MTLEKHEKFTQVIPTTHPPSLICLACQTFKCEHDEKLKILLHYINCHADVCAYEFSSEQREAYDQATMDVYLASQQIFGLKS